MATPCVVDGGFEVWCQHLVVSPAEMAKRSWHHGISWHFMIIAAQNPHVVQNYKVKTPKRLENESKRYSNSHSKITKCKSQRCSAALRPSRKKNAEERGKTRDQSPGDEGTPFRPKPPWIVVD